MREKDRERDGVCIIYSMDYLWSRDERLMTIFR